MTTLLEIWSLGCVMLRLGGALCLTFALMWAAHDGKAAALFLGASILGFALSYFGLKLFPGRICAKYKKLSRDFAIAYETALATKPTRFDDLPEMPLWTPYFESWLGVDEYRTAFEAKAFEATDVDALLDAFIVEFGQATRGEVALMRPGDSRDAVLLGPQGASAKQALGVKATGPKGELAVVAVEFAEALETWKEDENGEKKRVFDLDVDEAGADGKKCVVVTVAFSFWPKSAWPGKYSGPLGIVMQMKDVEGNTFERTVEKRFFKPRRWLDREYKGTATIVAPDFEGQTIELGTRLAKTADYVLERITANLRALDEDDVA